MEGVIPADDINIIKLQLRKPKRWNWELSTSKSSPHIALPTIQLYNSKGELLIEAKDYGMKRLSWSNIDRNKNFINQVQRCRSDIIKNPLIDTKSSKSRHLQKSQEAIDIRIRKSKSDILKPNNIYDTLNNYKPKLMNGEINIRSRAEILERLRKCSEESLKRAMADGYQKFLNVPRSVSDSQKDRKKTYVRCKSQYEKIADNEHKFDVSHFTHKKYKTRTSSAGTLIIDESFNSGYRRRRTENSTDKQKEPSNWKTINEHPNMLFQSNSTSNIPDKNCNYIVQEPITPVQDENINRGKRKTKLRRKHSIESTSSSAAEKRNRLKRKDDTKGRINKIKFHVSAWGRKFRSANTDCFQFIQTQK